MTRRFDTWTDLLASGTEQSPDGVGFCVLRNGEPPESITRGDLFDRALRVSRGLTDLGLRKGDVVVLLGDPSVAWSVTLAAVLLAGGMPAPVPPRSTWPELQRVLGASGAKFAVVSIGSAVFLAKDAAREKRILTFERSDGIRPSVEEMYSLDPTSPVLCRDTDLGVVMQTSGTTGNPKCVAHTHRSHMEFLDRWTDLTMNSDDRVLSFLPLNHQGGLLLSWFSAFHVGAPLYQLSRFSLSGFWDAVRTYDITWTGLMDPVPAYLLSAEPSPDDRNHSLRFVSGSRKPSEMPELEKRFGIRQMRPYGSTETTIVAMTVDLDRPEATGLTPEQNAACAGPAMKDWSFRIVGTDGNEAPTSETGALEVHGPSLFSCYLNDPEATNRAFTSDGWFKTGDRAYVNEHKELFFVERAGNSIRRSGEFISAVEVEEVLLAHPEISDACVLPVADELRGQEVRACVVRVTGSTMTAQEVFDHCLAELTKYKVPRYVDFWDELPRTSTFKISRGSLSSQPETWVDRYA